MRITDHAIVRYLERVYNMDIEKLKEEIAPEPIAKAVEQLGSGKYFKNGLCVIFKNGVIITVWGKR